MIIERHMQELSRLQWLPDNFDNFWDTAAQVDQ